LILEISKYRDNNIKTLEMFIKNKCDYWHEKRIIAEFAVATNVPIVAVCYLYKELKGTNSELDEYTNKLIQFYKYEEILL